mmetsp:Transcript_14970/g.26009  ORF Transcript_14970/g.26009 Transcript_14970/m.26009 type:complete len:118 (-) Transcript_14970:53-406(-)
MGIISTIFGTPLFLICYQIGVAMYINYRGMRADMRVAREIERRRMMFAKKHLKNQPMHSSSSDPNIPKSQMMSEPFQAGGVNNGLKNVLSPDGGPNHSSHSPSPSTPSNTPPSNSVP